MQADAARCSAGPVRAGTARGTLSAGLGTGLFCPPGAGRAGSYPWGRLVGAVGQGLRGHLVGGPGGAANPEILFAAGYSACFLGALKFVAGKEGHKLADEANVTASISFGPIPNGFGLQAELKIADTGLEHDVAKALVEKAHTVCPYSNATRGNIDVTLTVA